MLKRAGEEEITDKERIPIAEASFPMPFREGLEYSSPARGVWNIVHTGMLIPESHLIFVCALGCLRGVVMTAAEMNALDRFSAIQIREENVLSGGMEELMIEGVADIIGKLPRRPRAILLFISCQHYFLAYDSEQVFPTLAARFPDIRFVDCYMIPTLRKSGMTPNQRMQISMYRMWEKPEAYTKSVNLIGSNLEVSRSSELVRMVEEAGYEFRELHRCGDFDDYLRMARSCLNLVYEPAAIPAAEDIKERLGTDYRYLSFSYDYGELERDYAVLAGALGIGTPDFSARRTRAEKAVSHAKSVIGETPVVLDYTFTFRILSFARMLLEHGFNVTEIYADAFAAEDEENFDWIRENYPDLVISPTSRPAMRLVHGAAQEIHEDGESPEGKEKRVLAVGQKAAYFAGTDHFVNVAESGGYFGFDGIVSVMVLMEDAFLHTKDRRDLIQRKGYGCESCL